MYFSIIKLKSQDLFQKKFDREKIYFFDFIIGERQFYCGKNSQIIFFFLSFLTKKAAWKVYWLPLSYNIWYNFKRAQTLKLHTEVQKMWTLTSTFVTSELGETVETYGICCGDTVINDISLRKQEILDFVEMLNRLGASEIHACDLVEDFLGK